MWWSDGRLFARRGLKKQLTLKEGRRDGGRKEAQETHVQTPGVRAVPLVFTNQLARGGKARMDPTKIQTNAFVSNHKEREREAIMGKKREHFLDLSILKHIMLFRENFGYLLYLCLQHCNVHWVDNTLGPPSKY